MNDDQLLAEIEGYRSTINELSERLEIAGRTASKVLMYKDALENIRDHGRKKSLGWCIQVAAITLSEITAS